MLAAAAAAGDESAGAPPILAPPALPMDLSRDGDDEDASGKDLVKEGGTTVNKSTGTSGGEPEHNPGYVELPKLPSEALAGDLDHTPNKGRGEEATMSRTVDLTSTRNDDNECDDSDAKMSDNPSTKTDGNNNTTINLTIPTGEEIPVPSPSKKKTRLSKAEKKERKERKKREAENNRKEKRTRDSSPPKN